jgi:hypothetical protein
MAIIALFAAIAGLYLYVKKPDFFVILFFTLTIADVNFSIPGLPLNFRALIGLMAFIRAFTVHQEGTLNKFLNSPARMIIVFIIYTLIVSAAYDLLTFEFFKTSALTFISVYLGYVYYFKTRNISFIRTSMILAGLICLSDLVYTYVWVGQFPVQRVYQRLMNVPLVYDEYGLVVEPINWGFYGCICGMAFLMLLTEYIYNRKSSLFDILLMPMMFMGVLMSTSRSSLLGIIGASVFLIAKVLRNRNQADRARKLIMFGFGTIVLALFLFSVLQDTLNLEVEFVERISSRLIDEPIAVINKNLGYSYNAQELDALDWRGEISEVSYEAFMDLTFVEELFGIGFWGFTVRNLGHNNLPPHNGLLMLLIEYGIVGSVIWGIIFIGVVRNSFRLNRNTSPLLVNLLFLFLYCLGQNEILTQGLFFLMVSSLIAENQHLEQQRNLQPFKPARNPKNSLRVSTS